jgi:tetratricopeptide (TPR) repeat protein
VAQERRSGEGGGRGARGRSGPAAKDGRSDAGRRGGRREDRAARRSGDDRQRSRPRADDARRGDRARTTDQARYDGPPLDESITGSELDRSIRQQLRGLPEKLAARVARHLVAAGQLIHTDPRTAYEHTLAARARAARVAVVREACGEAAYAAEQYAEALAELRAARRINGAADYLPVMADCERALGRPEKALELAKSPAVANLAPELQAEMTIVEAGARRDMGDAEAAVRTLENAPLRSRSRADWVVRLRYAYADSLLAAGRRAEAVQWFHRTVGVDGEGITDAAERVVELEGAATGDDTEVGQGPGRG